MKYIKITRSDVSGSYIENIESILSCVDGELDNFNSMEPGDSITLTVVEMTEEEYKALPEFCGW